MRFLTSSALALGVVGAVVIGGCLPGVPSDGFAYGGSGGSGGAPSRESNGATSGGSKTSAAATGAGTTSASGPSSATSGGGTTSGAAATTGSGSAGATTSSSSGGGNATPTTCTQANDFYGCCDPAGTLYYCDAGQLQSLQCGSGTECGWNGSQGYYDCVASPGGPDPSGAHSMSCGGGSSSSSSSTTTSSSSGGGTGVTWTQVYDDMFGPNGTATCAGSSCHTYSKGGFKCGTSKSTCYTGFVSSGYVTPGSSAASSPIADPQSSPLCGSLGGNMPPSGGCITSSQLNELEAWLAAGAPNN